MNKSEFRLVKDKTNKITPIIKNKRPIITNIF